MVATKLSYNYKVKFTLPVVTASNTALLMLVLDFNVMSRQKNNQKAFLWNSCIVLIKIQRKNHFLCIGVARDIQVTKLLNAVIILIANIN